MYNNYCDCKDSHGNPKKLYSSKSEAEYMARLRESSSVVKLTVYPCPHSNGYHLTKSSRYDY